MSWVPKWRDRLVMTESQEKKAQRESLHTRLENLRKKQTLLVHKIQDSQEDYERIAEHAARTRLPNQNGSGRRKFLETAAVEQKAQKALRPSDRQLYARMYSSVANFIWKVRPSFVLCYIRHVLCPICTDTYKLVVK
jgi:hypothetical protein